MRRAIIFGTSFATILALAYLWPMLGGSKWNGNARGAMCIAGHCCCTGTGGGGGYRRADRRAAALDARSKPVRRSGKGSVQIRGEKSGAAGATALLLRMRQGGRSSESARLLSRHAWRVVRNLHRRGAAGEADVRAGLAGRSDTRRDPQEFRAGQLKSGARGYLRRRGFQSQSLRCH